MIIWKGLGILGLLIPFAIGALLQFFFPENYLFPGLGYILGSLPFWFLGRTWNAQTAPDPTLDAFGNFITKEHSAFFIPLQYWTLIFLGIGISILIKSELSFFIFDKGLQVFALYLGSVMVYFLYLKLKKPNAYNRHVKPIFDKNAKPEKSSTHSKNIEKVKSNRTSTPKNTFQKPTIEKESLKDFGESDHSRFFPKPKNNQPE